MEKKVAAYEAMYVIDASLADDAIAAVVSKFKALAEENATDVVVTEWGKRRLAYPIAYKNEGYYVLMNFKSEPAFPAELERVLGITEGVIRSMTTRFDGAVVTAAPAQDVPVSDPDDAPVREEVKEEPAEEKASEPAEEKAE